MAAANQVTVPTVAAGVPAATAGHRPGLSLPQGTALSIGAVLGTGVIALPALAAEEAGPASLIAWLAMVVVSIPLAMTFAALGARYPDAGGVSTYVRTAFGARAAAAVGWCFYFAVPVGAPPAAMFAGAYVAAATGGGTGTTVAVAAVLVLVVTVANAGGVRVSGRLQLGLAGVLVALLVVSVIAALPHARVENLQPFAPHGWAAILPACAVLLWGFAGWEAVTSLAGELRDPARNVPRVTAFALAVVAVLYLGVAATSLLVLGDRTGSTEAPLAELLAMSIGGSMRTITAVVAVLLTLGAMNAYFAGAAKLGAALGRDGALPGWLAEGSAVGAVPRRSLLVVSTLSLASLAVVGVTGVGPRPAVLLTTGSFAVVYLLGTAAAVRLLPRGSRQRRTAVVALGVSVALLLVTGVYVLWAAVVVLAALAYLRWAPGSATARGKDPAEQDPAGHDPAGQGPAVS